MNLKPAQSSQLLQSLQKRLSCEVLLDDAHAGRSTAPMPASTRSCPWASCCRARATTSCARCRWPPKKAGPSFRAAAARAFPGNRSARARSRLQQVHEPDRNRPAVAHRARAARRRARSVERRGGGPRPAIRTRRGHQQPREHRRHDRQQLGRGPFDLARQGRRQRNRAGHGAGRRRHGHVRPAHAGGAAARTSAHGCRGTHVSRSRADRPRKPRRNRGPLSRGPAPRERL